MVIIAIQRLKSHKWLEHVLADDGEADKTNMEVRIEYQLVSEDC